MKPTIPILVGGTVAFYVWRNRHGPLSLRNGGDLHYRPIGEPGEPYPEWVRALVGQSGVYVIREIAADGSKEVVYVGMSQTDRLYNTLTRHFQKWRRWKSYWHDHPYGEGHDPGMTYKRGSVEVATRITSRADALDEEARLIKRLQPRDNILGQTEEETIPF